MAKELMNRDDIQKVDNIKQSKQASSAKQSIKSYEALNR
jgi:hypothetical protein